MPDTPSFKGSLLASFVELLSKGVDEGRVSSEDLEARLEPEALALMGSGVRVAGWYDIRFYAQFVEAMRDLLGDGDDDSVREIGARTAETLLEGGLYQQLEYLTRSESTKHTDPKERSRAFGRDLRLAITMGAAVFSFGQWSAREDPDDPERHLVEIRDAGDYPDVFLLATEGFMNRLAAARGSQPVWAGERPSPDRVRFRTIRPV